MSSNMPRPQKSMRKTRRAPFRVTILLTVALCVIVGIICVYNATKRNKRETLREADTVATQLITPFTDDSFPTQPIPPLSGNDSSYPSFTSSVDTADSVYEHSVIHADEASVINKLELNVNIKSTNAILMDMENEEILFDKNGFTRIYPASMTKIMTAVVAIERIADLNEKIMLREAIFQPIHAANAVTAGFLPGESVRAIDLLFGLLLPSGAECAVSLAEYAAGSEKSFIESMNDKAREIGMEGSNFTNATGLHDKNHYSTAKDIAVLLRYALQDETFYEIITSSRHSTPSTNKHDGGITYYSTLFSGISGTAEFDGGLILGGKTGYTSEAGQCLASFAIKDDAKYILVTAGAAGDNQTQIPHIEDAFTIYAAIP